LLPLFTPLPLLPVNGKSYFRGGTKLKLEKAIEKLKVMRGDPTLQFEPDEIKAINLLIEAGKWRLHCQKSVSPSTYGRLPGETEE